MKNKIESNINLGLDRIKAVLELMKIDYQGLKVIHVSGTNGKGSTAAFLNDVLMNNFFEFKKVGLYTSPHLEKINERIKINNKEITDQELKICLDFVDDAQGSAKIELTYFEHLTAAAIKYFCDQGVDVVVLECGLGGRLDATNVFDNPLVTILTNISMDHTEYLGDSLEEILNEKMGIFKKGVPIVSGVEQEFLQKKIAERAKGLKAEC